MKEYLIFQLFGPMASWGEIAVGEIRASASHPTKSALLGLLSASLGIERNQEELHQQLARSYLFAVRLDFPGTPLRDFHTIQSPEGKKNRNLLSRREEILQGKEGSLATLLSKRDYYCDQFVTIALCPSSFPPLFSLDEIKKSLVAPKFSLSLGRKSCPLALPLRPRIQTSESIQSLFQEIPLFFELDGILRSLQKKPFQPPQKDRRVRIFWETDAVAPPSQATQTERWDEPLHRGSWQFRPRMEFSMILQIPDSPREEDD